MNDENTILLRRIRTKKKPVDNNHQKTAVILGKSNEERKLIVFNTCKSDSTQEKISTRLT